MFIGKIMGSPFFLVMINKWANAEGIYVSFYFRGMTLKPLIVSVNHSLLDISITQDIIDVHAEDKIFSKPLQVGRHVHIFSPTIAALITVAIRAMVKPCELLINIY